MLGIRLLWLMLGVLAYPVLYLLARLAYVRQAEQIERDFTALLAGRP